jgi:UDP-N-acetylglucosamine--dolichyl-phosphate N-acetylglucosaminephosphotransferase
MMIEYALIAGFLVALIGTYIAVPRIMDNAREKNFIGRDVHKTKRVFIPELGGLSILLGFAVGAFAFIGLSSFLKLGVTLIPIFAALSSIFIITFVGLMDDIFWIRWRTKIILPLLAAIPIMSVMLGNTTMSIPFIGPINLGLIYTFILIPLGITGAANAVNMIGGYNGSEAGLGILLITPLLIIALASGSMPAAALLISMLGALLAFLVFNWYPAKTFMGDTGTLQIGAVIATAVIIGNMEKYAFILMFWYFVNLMVFTWGLLTGAKLVKFASPNKNGTLTAPKGFWKHYLPFIIIHYTKPTEKQLVQYLLGLQLLASIATLAMYFGGF